LDGELGFTVMVGGFFSASRNELAVPLGLWLRPQQLADFSLAVLLHYERQGLRASRHKSRLMYLIDQLGLEAYRQELIEAFASLGKLRRCPRRQPSGQPGPPLRAGRPGPEATWLALGRPECAHGPARCRRPVWPGPPRPDLWPGELRLTEAQNVLIPGIASNQLESLLAEPLLQRFRTEPGPLEAEAVSCTGNRYCSFALIPT
jgi:ferredoxin-nitrite reductase